MTLENRIYKKKLKERICISLVKDRWGGVNKVKDINFSKTTNEYIITDDNDVIMRYNIFNGSNGVSKMFHSTKSSFKVIDLCNEYMEL